MNPTDPVDLRELLDSWPYDPDDNVRLTHGVDGREVMQVRQPMGIEQYELEGRPDGQRPHGKESALEHHLQRLARAKTAGNETAFKLGAEDCVELFNEGVIYYYRYIHFFQLKDWVRTVRDTSRNLRVFDLVSRYAERDEDRVQLEQWRPYITRMNAVARAMTELESKRYDAALKITQETMAQIESLPEMDNETFKFERQRSLMALQELVTEIEKTRPVSELEQLQRALDRAVAAEKFEQAAALRDRIRALRDKPVAR